MSVTLNKPCPFCGKRRLRVAPFDADWQCQCIECGATGPRAGCENKAREAWRTRQGIDTEAASIIHEAAEAIKNHPDVFAERDALRAEVEALREKARTLYSAAEQLAYAAGGTVACHAQPFPPEIERLDDALTDLRDVLWQEDNIRPLLESPEAEAGTSA